MQIFSAIGASRTGQFACICCSYFLIEFLSAVLLHPNTLLPLVFGILWSLLQTSFILLFPRKVSRILFGVSFFTNLLWVLTQAGYYRVFGKMMWLSTLLYAGEGAMFIGDVLLMFPLHWWILGIFVGALGGLLIRYFPIFVPSTLPRVCPVICAGVCILGLFITPAAVFADDSADIPIQETEEAAYEEAYGSMHNAKAAYDICGVYHLTFRDFWVNGIYPLTQQYEEDLQNQLQTVDHYFDSRPKARENKMTGIFQGKNVILVLMESMDDWLISQEHTPTICKLMHEGINFTEFYTPGYGSARTLNSEFCMNTGIYLPTSGSYVFDYLENSYDQSIANQLTANGYTSEVFHYNDPDFYSRGDLEPAMGYRHYNSFDTHIDDAQLLYDECLLFDIPTLEQLFFREGQTFNTVITRSAHMSYSYSENLSEYAISVHPEYRGMFGSEEEDCARAKARLVDDFFAALIKQLQSHGKLEDTVIVAMTDHYTYGYQDDAELFALSGLPEEQALLLEKTPCFIWSSDTPGIEVTKTLHTADLLPTVLNLLGIRSPYSYLGQDAFDPDYVGYAIFPDGSWISEGIVCTVDEEMEYNIIANKYGSPVSDELLSKMSSIAQSFIEINNLMLITNYYAQP